MRGDRLGAKLGERLARPPARQRRVGIIRAPFIAASAGPPPTPAALHIEMPGVLGDDGLPFVVDGVPYLPTYAPTVGDYVWIDTSSVDWVVTGKAF